jgi:hypothetical protein
MARTVRRVVFLIAFVLVVGAVVVVITTRPDLQDSAEKADRAWVALLPQLNARYQALAGVEQQLEAAGVGDRQVVKDLKREIAVWVNDEGTDPGGQAKVASTLEALAARAVAMRAAPRLAGNAALLQAVTTFNTKKPSAALVRRYNDDVTAYQKTRTKTMTRIVASLDGYSARPTLQLAATAI